MVAAVDPESMTSEERRLEVSGILARGDGVVDHQGRRESC